MTAKKRFRSLWVILHWLMAVLVFVTFGIGLTSLGKTSPAEGKQMPLTVHILLGIGILIIVIVRYGMRLLIFKPPRRTAPVPGVLSKKIPFLDLMSVYVHPLLYLFSGLMAVLGLAVAWQADLFQVLFSGTKGKLPADFFIFPARTWHGTVSLVLLILIGQHILAAVFHQFIKGENFIGRMWFIKNRPAGSVDQNE